MLPLVRDTFRRTAWWAPAAVLILHKVVMPMGLRAEADWLMHFSGGLAISYFIWTAIPILERWLGTLSRAWRLIIAFTGGCTAALIWDLAEFASDRVLNSKIQHSLHETMLDLAYGFAGATLTSIILLLSISLRSEKQQVDQSES